MIAIESDDPDYVCNRLLNRELSAEDLVKRLCDVLKEPQVRAGEMALSADDFRKAVYMVLPLAQRRANYLMAAAEGKPGYTALTDAEANRELRRYGGYKAEIPELAKKEKAATHRMLYEPSDDPAVRDRLNSEYFQWTAKSNALPEALEAVDSDADPNYDRPAIGIAKHWIANILLHKSKGAITKEIAEAIDFSIAHPASAHTEEGREPRHITHYYPR